jgi:hypothetical protein
MAFTTLVNGSIADASAVMANLNAICPVGKIMYFDDLNGVNTVDTGIFAALNGQTISDAGSPYNGLALKDVSGRYIVGYGTDGGGDIASAAYAMTVVGNVGHSVNLSHTHTVAHNHSLIIAPSTYAGGSLGGANGVGTETPTTSSGGSATQSIQPRSVTFRAYVRFK